MSIKFDHVSYTYGKKTPFEQIGIKDINLEISNKSFVALIGHTGSGKSTLAQHLNGLLLPDVGEVSVDDFVIYPNKKKNKKIKDIRKYVGLVFQFPEYQLFEETVIKDVAFGPKNFGMSDEEAKKKAREALISVGIDETYFERSPFELSGGERRRVAIAGILALEPRILVLDEPSAGLDPVGVKDMMSLFKLVHEKGTRIFIVTHDMDLVLEYCDYVVVMQNGQIERLETPIELFSSIKEGDFNLELPSVFKLANALIDRGLPLNIQEIYSIETLVKEIKRVRCQR